MGVFTKDLNNETIFEWIYEFRNIEYNWFNPIDKIIKKISDYAKS